MSFLHLTPSPIEEQDRLVHGAENASYSGSAPDSLRLFNALPVLLFLLLPAGRVTNTTPSGNKSAVYTRFSAPGNHTPREEDPMSWIVTHTHQIDLQTDTMIRLDNLDAMITILRSGIEGDGDSVPTTMTIKNYLFHLGQEVELIRQNLGKINFQESPDSPKGRAA